MSRELQGCYYGPNSDHGGRMQLGKELHDFVSLCVEHGVRFLVVGGYAVAAHGHPLDQGSGYLGLDRSRERRPDSRGVGRVRLRVTRTVGGAFRC